MSVDEYVKTIKKEQDPQKVIELWSSAIDAKENSGLTIKDLMFIHKKCNKEITQAALQIESINFE
jgi:hypothetical protein|tara:strand:- start:1283 stop:1477 length:195 start_codon:yes stop_codon:yes gene_type:complete